MKLNGSVVQDVSLHAQSQFGRGGSIFKGLLKMVKDYRFDSSYATVPGFDYTNTRGRLKSTPTAFLCVGHSRQLIAVGGPECSTLEYVLQKVCHNVYTNRQ